MKNREEEVYIVNLVAKLTVLYYVLSWFGWNLVDLTEFNRNSRLWQNLVEIIDYSRLR